MREGISAKTGCTLIVSISGMNQQAEEFDLIIVGSGSGNSIP